MDFTQQLISYYKGERFEAVLVAVFGLIAIGIAISMWQYQNQMLRGLFYPVAFLAIFTFVVGVFGTYNNTQRIESLPLQYVKTPKEFVHNEFERFEGKNGVNTWWMPLKTAWAIIAIVGIILSFTTKNEFISGIAIGLILIGASGFIIDGFAHQRAKIYTGVLVEMKSVIP